MTEDQEGDDPQGSDSTGDPQLDRQVADLEQSGEKVSDRIEETRSDWEAKKGDPSVPGAVPDPMATDDSSDEDDDSGESSDEDDGAEKDGESSDEDQDDGAEKDGESSDEDEDSDEPVDEED
ncbi:MAG: hypothetical protein ACR2J6_00740 [Thermoleophilaceae bacterium]